jgi:hypothetical protein
MKTTVPAGDRLVALLATLVSLIGEQIPGLRFVAAPHVPEGGTAAYLRAPVYTQDSATDPRWEGCREWRTL